MQELPPVEFRFGNYGAGIPFDVYMDTKKLVALMALRGVGFCHTPEYRSIPGQVAVMFESEDFSRCWSHVPDYVFAEFMEGL